ncbi:hypothetical protein [Nocardioides sp. B-3]|uniref:hypothetical protein n=1 Tax=Nocardioides sp. B-3 TaxID=2895565 RepID=UPI00215229DD|nr:hypothetical protein [Nocardioides sp. B-3]UUZ60833.1 hypothetical protein LP418_08870 [Nocardioides sp. B-3]
MESFERDRLRFAVLPDGTVEGDDGDGGNLASTLRYACRMGAQIGDLLELGGLERLSTLSNLAIAARVSGESPELSITAEVEMQGTKRPELVAVSITNAKDAIDRAPDRVTVGLASDWAAVITAEGHPVGLVHDETMGPSDPEVLQEVGVRVLAVLGALVESLRETAVRLDYRRGSVLIMTIGDHALYTHADKVEASEVVRTVGAVQGPARQRGPRTRAARHGVTARLSRPPWSGLPVALRTGRRRSSRRPPSSASGSRTTTRRPPSSGWGSRRSTSLTAV